MRTPLSHYVRSIPGALLTAGCMLLAACTDESAIAPPTANADNVAAALDMNHPAVTLAVGQTTQLVATPRAFDGSALPVVGTLTWESSDTSLVIVDADGTLHGKAVGSGVVIATTLVDIVGNRTTRTSATVNVTATAYAIETFDLNAPVPMSPTGPFPVQLPLMIIDSDGNLVTSEVAVSFTQDSKQNGVLQAFGGSAAMRLIDTGSVTVYARSFAYGVDHIDSVTITGTTPTLAVLTVYDRAYVQGRFGIVGSPFKPSIERDAIIVPARVTIKAGGQIIFQNRSISLITTPDIDVVFDDLTDILPAENIALPRFGGASRMFPVAGTYAWTSAVTGQSGEIIVVP